MLGFRGDIRPRNHFCVFRTFRRTTTRKKKYPPEAGISKALKGESEFDTPFLPDSVPSRKKNHLLATGFYCPSHSGLFFGKPKKEKPRMHSYFAIDKTPPPIRRVDEKALRQFTESLEEGARRRHTALHTCHRPRIQPERCAYSGNSSAYVPQFSARLLNDPNLTDGARRCAVKLLELVYRRNRTGRSYQGTVLYLAKCLQRSERSIQNYLAQLRAGGYIRHEVITSSRARMCIGVFITLLEPLFPKHHAREWPVQAMTSAVKKDSENYRPESKYRRNGRREEVEHWALRCMDGVFRSLMKTIPPAYGSLA